MQARQIPDTFSRMNRDTNQFLTPWERACGSHETAHTQSNARIGRTYAGTYARTRESTHSCTHAHTDARNGRTHARTHAQSNIHIQCKERTRTRIQTQEAHERVLSQEAHICMCILIWAAHAHFGARAHAGAESLTRKPDYFVWTLEERRK